MNITHEIEYSSGKLWCYFKYQGRIVGSVNTEVETAPEVFRELIDAKLEKIKAGVAKAEELAKTI